MKTIKYLFMGALLTGFGTAATAQDGTKADVDAVKAMIKSKPADMAKQLNNYYKKNKKNAENLVAFGRAFYEAKDTANAMTFARYALAANKQYAPAYLLRGDIESLGDDGGAAAQNYEQAIYFDSKNPEPYKKYALVYRKIDPSGAVQKLEDLRSVRPDYPVDALIGHINYISLRYSKAIDAFSRVPIDQLERMDYIEYAMSNWHARQYDKSLSIVKAGLQKEPNNATLNRIAMMSNVELEQYPEALHYADILFNKVDKDSVTLSDMDYSYFGKAYAGNKQYDEAIAKFREALAQKSDDTNMHGELYKQISDAYKAMKDFPQAIANYGKYLENTAEPSATDHATLGLLNMQHARTLEGDERIAAFRQADQVFADLITKYPDAEEYGLLQRGYVNASMDPDMSQGLAKPYFEKLANLISAREERDATDNKRLEDSYRYLMSYNYSVLKDNRAALDYANKILEVKPDDEGIQKVVETLSKNIK